jgi:pilus assembly protein Flp/PilA
VDVTFRVGSAVKTIARGTLNLKQKGESKIRTSIARFVKDESGATAIDYALIAAGIGVAILVSVNALGTKLSGMFDTIASDLTPAK